MYGKIFDSIYEGTLYGQWEALVTFQQMIVLCDADGMIDMTPQAIAARTSIPLKIIQKGIAVLEAPDPFSRTPDQDGRRIERIDAHRPWGWHIVNHEKYMRMQDADMIRAQTRERVRKHRAAKGDVTVTDGNASKRHTDTDTDKDTNKEKPTTAADAARLEGFEIFWKSYPRRAGNNPKHRAEKAYRARLAEKYPPESMIDGAGRYAKYIRAIGKEGTEYVLQAATFLGQDKGFLQDWLVPSAPSSKPPVRREVCDYCGAPRVGSVNAIVHCRDHHQDALDGKEPQKATT